MNILGIDQLEIANKQVLIRGDLDVDDGDNPRVDSVRKIVEYVLSRGAVRVKVIGHREAVHMICEQLRDEYPGVEFFDELRSDRREKANSVAYAMELAGEWEVYINESFATSHRKHTSIDALPLYMKRMGRQVGMGIRFEKEIEMISDVWKKSGKRVLVIGGSKVDDKERFASMMGEKFYKVLRGGLLPGVDLRPDGLDISDRCIEEYKSAISEADVILAAGVMGKYEDTGSSKGTYEVLKAISESKAYKIAGGGDIEMAISRYGFSDSFDWISVGGGAMLSFLETGTLVGMEALKV